MFLLIIVDLNKSNIEDIVIRIIDEYYCVIIKY